MAWVTPSTRTTGTVITAAIWNQDVVSNPILLKTPIADSGALRFPSITTTTATSTYEMDIADDVIAITSGDVTVKLASTTSSSTGRMVQVKNLGTGTVRIYSNPSVLIDGSTSTSIFTLTSEESLTLFRLRAADWIII